MRGARLCCRKPLSASHRHKPSVCSSPPPQHRLCTLLPSWLARPQRATLAPLAMRVRWPRHSFDPHSVLCSPPGSSDWWLYVVRPKKTFDGLYWCFPARFPSSVQRRCRTESPAAAVHGADPRSGGEPHCSSGSQLLDSTALTLMLQN